MAKKSHVEKKTSQPAEETAASRVNTETPAGEKFQMMRTGANQPYPSISKTEFLKAIDENKSSPGPIGKTGLIKDIAESIEGESENEVNQRNGLFLYALKRHPSAANVFLSQVEKAGGAENHKQRIRELLEDGEFTYVCMPLMPFMIIASPELDTVHADMMRDAGIPREKEHEYSVGVVADEEGSITKAASIPRFSPKEIVNITKDVLASNGLSKDTEWFFPENISDPREVPMSCVKGFTPGGKHIPRFGQSTSSKDKDEAKREGLELSIKATEKALSQGGLSKRDWNELYDRKEQYEAELKKLGASGKKKKTKPAGVIWEKDDEEVSWAYTSFEVIGAGFHHDRLYRTILSNTSGLQVFNNFITPEGKSDEGTFLAADLSSMADGEHGKTTGKLRDDPYHASGYVVMRAQCGKGTVPNSFSKVNSIIEKNNEAARRGERSEFGL